MVLNFKNEYFIVDKNPFVENETCREVLTAIAQMAYSWARINEDDELDTLFLFLYSFD